MLKHAFALALLSSLLLAQAGFAEEVLVDQWAEDFIGGQKVGYAHIRVIQTATGYREERREWWPIKGDLYREQSQIETDRLGRVLKFETKIRTALGTSRTFGERRGEALHWGARYRGQTPLTGEIEGEVHDSAIVGLLQARGKRPRGEAKLRLLDLPQGVKEKTFQGDFADGILTFEEEDTFRIHDAEGALVHELRLDMQAERRQAVSEAQAKDMTRRSPGLEGSGLVPGLVKHEGLTLRAPQGGWAAASTPPGPGDEDDSFRMILIHPYRVVMIGQVIQLPMSADLDTREAMAGGMEDALNRGSEESGTSYSLGRPITAWGQPGIHYEIESDFQGERVEGEAWIVRYSPSESLLLLLFAPSDKKSETAALVRAAKGSLQVKPQERLQATTFPGGFRVELPEDWRKGETRGRAAWTSPQGAYLTAWVQETPGQAPQDFLKDWADHTATRLNATPGPVQRVLIDGRQVFKVEVAAEKAGTRMKVRLVTGADGPGRTFLLVAIDTEEGPAGLVDKVLSGAKWTTKR